MKTKIIGHRGAAGLELENTATSIKRAISLKVDAVEIDTRLTKDGQLVLCHDPSLSRVSNHKLRIKNHTLEELQRLRLADGSRLLSLKEALEIIDKTPVIIELKDSGSSRPLLNVLQHFPTSQVSVASFRIEELAILRKLAPDMFIYALEHTKLIDGISSARLNKLNGIGLNYWLLNPLTYYLAKRSGLKVYIYTFNRKLLARFVSFLYPDVAICTDHPEWFLHKGSSHYARNSKTY